MPQDANQKDGTQEFWSSPIGATPAPQELGPGLKLKDRYLIERELGRGGIGVVYLARDERLHGMPVVIKFLLDNTDKNAWLQRKFLQEAEALTRINHPGVVRVIDKDRAEDGRPFFVMEFVKGKPLRAVMSDSGMDFEYAAQLAQQIGHALGAAHREGILHRDLKPENIMLQALSDEQEQVKLIDFGIARVKDSQVGATTDIPVIAGSLQYITPEQLSGGEVSAATDIYSFGIIAYEMLTGRRPFNADAPTQLASMHQLLEMQRTESLVLPKQLRPSLPVAAQNLILHALAYEPGRRPQDARAFGHELALALTSSASVDQATVLVPPPPTDPQVSFEIAPLVTVANSGRETQRVLEDTRRETPAVIAPRAPKHISPIWIGLAVVTIAAVVIGLFVLKPWSKPEGMRNPANTSAPPPTVEAERVLNYAITVQKDPSRYPGSKPFQLPGEVIFSPGDRVRFTLGSPQAGWLYLINESPALAGGATSFNILFPSPTSNKGAAQLAAGQQINVPEREDGYFKMDQEEGAEKLWLVWSANAIAELEALKRWANPQDKGEIKDPGQVNALREFLAKQANAKLEVDKDDTKKQTTVKGNGDLLVKLVKLEHH